jgi:hypothetical protein
MAIGNCSGRIRQLHLAGWSLNNSSQNNSSQNNSSQNNSSQNNSSQNDGNPINGATIMDQHASPNQAINGETTTRKGSNIVHAVIALALGLSCIGSVLAGHGAQHPSKDVDAAPTSETPHFIFTGSTGTVGMDAHHTDELVFDEDTFHSRECHKIGFDKSTFKIAREGNEIQFSAVNISDKYGTLTWQGIIRDGVIEARYQWKKERMFWTIEREYWFIGEVSNVRR